MLKEGDRVRCIKSFAGESRLVGRIGTVVSTKHSNSYSPIGVEFDDWSYGHDCDGKCSNPASGRWGNKDSLELVHVSVKKHIKETMTNMNIYAQKILGKKTKALVKAGFLNEQLKLTDKGKDTLLAILFTENKAEMVGLAEEINKENEK
jgi:hypothetical protein